MSSLFSYELDEAQIRSTLQNSRDVDYHESSWDDFESKFDQQTSHQHLPKFKLPEFNLNINRNVLLPAIFIAGLVGVSAIMLSFVDFKTNTPAQVEKSLIPNPHNFKAEETKTSAIVKQEIPKPAPKESFVKKDSVPAQVEKPVETPTVSASLANNTNAVNHINTPVNPPIQARVSIPDTNSVSAVNSSVMSPPVQNTIGQKRKRRRKVPTDQIEAIKAPSILGQQEASAKEPELELKLNRP
jgi:hypothetical protein